MDDMVQFINKSIVALKRMMLIGDILIEYSTHRMSAEVAMANIEAIYLGKEDENGED